MKTYALGAALAALSPLASAICSYPLDATAAQYASATITPFPYLNFQSAEYVSQSTVDAGGLLYVVNYHALSDTGFAAMADSYASGLPGGDVTLPTSGIVAFEMAVDHFPATESNEAINYLSAGFASSNGVATADGIAVNIVLANSGWGSGSFATVIAGANDNGMLAWGDDGMQALTLPLPAGYRVGLYLNMDTRQVGYTVNGVDHGYLQVAGGGAFTIPDGVQSVVLGMNGVLQATAASPLAGTPVGGTLVTDRSQFTQPFPAGTTDICSGGGDAGVLRLPNGKPFPGKANPRGLQRFQGLPLPVHPLGQYLKAQG